MALPQSEKHVSMVQPQMCRMITPKQYQRDASGEYVIRDGQKVETEAWKDYKSIWGEPTEKDENGKYINKYIPKLINPNKPNGEKYEDKPF